VAIVIVSLLVADRDPVDGLVALPDLIGPATR
jgi:hypothetical protein